MSASSSLFLLLLTAPAALLLLQRLHASRLKAIPLRVKARRGKPGLKNPV